MSKELVGKLYKKISKTNNSSGPKLSSASENFLSFMNRRVEAEKDARVLRSIKAKSIHRNIGEKVQDNLTIGERPVTIKQNDKLKIPVLAAESTKSDLICPKPMKEKMDALKQSLVLSQLSNKINLPAAPTPKAMPPQEITVTINGQVCKCTTDKNIFQVAMANDIYIPGLCGHPDFCAKGNCRVCVVEVKGRRNLVTSCSTKVEDKMDIHTDSERVKRSRNLNIELIFAEHIEKCATCVWRTNCKLLDLADRYKILITTFKDRKGKRKTYKFANAVEIDGTQCIDCRNCIDACSKMQKINYLEIKGKGIDQEIVPTRDRDIDCIYCGQCAVHCPVGSAQEQIHWDMALKAIKNESKTVVAMIAPSVRVSIGEEFGIGQGKIMTEQMVAGLKALGFDYVFDVNFAADITTLVEAEELLQRVTARAEAEKKNQEFGSRKQEVGRQMAKSYLLNSQFPITNSAKLPMFTSCCPAWVKYVEFYRPDLIPNLTTSRSPQVHCGGVVKTYWAEKMKINPKDIVTVSIMPCTAKKFESSREEMKVNGQWPVDYVLTVRELAMLLKFNKIEFGKLKNQPPDNPLGESSSSALIYGSSGGVMESALRAANHMVCQGKKSCKVILDYQEVRGLEGVKEAIFQIDKTKVRVAVVNCIGNIEPILARTDQYDYIEVMACPGGCIGGGGQPYPTTPAIRQKRMEALYKFDAKQEKRIAQQNQGAVEVLKWLDSKGKLKRQVLHTKYVNRKKGKGLNFSFF